MATYFIPRNWKLHPDQVALGSVIADVKAPNNPVSESTLPDLIAPAIPPPDKGPLSGTARSSQEWSAGLFSTFLQLMTIGGEFSVSSSSNLEIEYSCDSVETREFVPSEDDIKKAAEDSGVSNYLKMGGLGSKAFMITGIKVANEATITKTEEAGKELTGQLGLEFPTVPITIGPKGSHKTSNSRQTTETVKGPFVFAFQVEKLRVGLRGKVTHKGYVKGAMLARGKENEDEYIIECVGQGLDDEEAEDFDVELRSGVVDGSCEACAIVIA